MKTTFLFLMISAKIFSQNKIIGNVLNTKIENRVGVEIPMKFDISKECQDSLKKTKDYISAAKGNPKSKNLLAERLSLDLSLMAFSVKFKLKNPNSFNLTPDSKGFIIYESGILKISFPFKAKNELGNEIDMTAVKTGESIIIF